MSGQAPSGVGVDDAVATDPTAWQPRLAGQAVSVSELKRLGASDKRAFFERLRPGAEAAERKYGIPAAVTLAQAALESGWGASALPGYNLFGIKGRGSAGSTSSATQEVYGGRWVNTRDKFAAYSSMEEAFEAHGKLFHNGYYDRAVTQYARDRNPHAFARNITGVYATDPNYGQKISRIMREWNLA
jgi:flagellum-specific peptidoglycan hydrolase FlgJ